MVENKIVRTQDEINQQLDWARDYDLQAKGYTQTYEQGVYQALMWLFGWDGNPPLECGPDDD